MKKLLSLIKACMSSNMSLFKIKAKNDKKSSKILLPVILIALCSFSIGNYAAMLIEPLVKINHGYVLLTLFVFATFLLTLIEGIYKSSDILFNAKDDELLLSLPIKKSTILFVKIFKFYVFEVLYNSLFLLPAIIVYTMYVKVDFYYYLVSFMMLILLPIIPIFISCIIGSLISSASSKFKYKNIVQIIITTILLLLLLYVSFNLENLIKDLIMNANSINGIINKIYYPAYVYSSLAVKFNFKLLLTFILLNAILFVTLILLLSKRYFKINSSLKIVNTKIEVSNKYSIKINTPIKSIIKKELNKFINTPIFVINAGFGLILFIVACIMFAAKFDDITKTLMSEDALITLDSIKSYIPLITFELISVASFTSSITSSMISLEGKSFSILKSLPISPYKILIGKVLSAVVIMIPFILIGNVILFVKFKLKLLQIVILLLCSLAVPLFSQIIGIIFNLKYPKMDAENDTEVVKQSMSVFVSIMFGFLLIGINAGLVFGLSSLVSSTLSLLITLAIYVILCILSIKYLKTKGSKLFNEISI